MTHVAIRELGGPEAAAGLDTAYTLPGVIGRFEGTLSHRTDEDWVRVTLVAGATYDITLAGRGENGVPDTVLTVYDADGMRLAGNDDVNAAAGRFDSRLQFTPPADGTYYLSARGYSANPERDNAGDYTLTLAGGPGAESGFVESE